jgi:predicted transcriptional regulator of viral defense system
MAYLGRVVPATEDVIEMATGYLDLLPTLFTYHEAIEAGVSKRHLYAMREAGEIKQVARGIFMRSDSDELIDLDLAEIAIRAPDATLCLSSALVRHDLTDANPVAIDVTVPAGSHRPAVSPPVKWHRFDAKTFAIGRNSLPIYGDLSIGLYSAERCIVDAFRLRWSEGDDLAYIALRRWLGRRGSKPAALYEMARNFPKTLPVILNAVQTLTYE